MIDRLYEAYELLKQYAKNWTDKKWREYHTEDEPTAAPLIQYENVDSIPNTYFALDTILLERRPNMYVLPGSINLSQHKFGYHNAFRQPSLINVVLYPQFDEQLNEIIDLNEKRKWANRPVKSPGLVITSFHPFVPFDRAVLYMNYYPDNKTKFMLAYPNGDVLSMYEGKTYHNAYKLLGIDEFGNIKFNNFKSTDMVSPFPFVSNVTDIKYDPKLKDYFFYSGNKPVSKLLFTNAQSNPDKYGHVPGGVVIVKTDSESRILLGSLNNILSGFLDFKQRHKNEKIDVYKNDLGSFNTGLRTYNGEISTKDWQIYTGLNRNGGSGLYILPSEQNDNLQLKLSNAHRLKLLRQADKGLEYFSSQDVLLNSNGQVTKADLSTGLMHAPSKIYYNPLVPGIYNSNENIEEYLLYKVNKPTRLNSGLIVYPGQLVTTRRNLPLNSIRYEIYNEGDDPVKRKDRKDILLNGKDPNETDTYNNKKRLQLFNTDILLINQNVMKIGMKLRDKQRRYTKRSKK